MKAIYAGSFDPLTLGHLDIIRRAAKLVSELVIAVMVNPDKPGFFPHTQRIRLIEMACAQTGIYNVRVISDQGLLTDLAQAQGCRLLIRGLRNSQDLESESAMAQANALLLPGLETVFLAASSQHSSISSSLIRQIAALGGDVSHFVPACVRQALNTHFQLDDVRSARI